MEENKTENISKEIICIKSTSNKPRGDGDLSQISISEFLSYLKTAYQVQDSVEDLLMEGGMNEAVEWLKSKEAEFSRKGKSLAVQTSNSLLQRGNGDEKKEAVQQSKRKNSTINVMHDSDILKKKLSEVLSEGLLDSVLPYLMQGNHPVKKCMSCNSSVKNAEKTTSHSAVLTVSNSISNDRLIRRKSSGDTSSSSNKVTITKTESEVEIHVCDEVKNMKKTFVCNQKLLVDKMGYFAEVTLGQRLEDMDISVHCDIGIFEWLMQWVKKDSLLEADWPQLDSQCVIPILVSAAFLQMEPLLQDCLLFCHEHMNEILRNNTNLSCLNDSVLTRLAAMYTNTEVESIKDRKDKIQSRLFAKLIQSLAEPEPESVRGHWCSLARIFRCEKCQQLITPNVAAKIPCIPACMRLQHDGSIISLHTRDSNWNINDYIIELQRNLKTWRKVYWRLWGKSHFLYCVTCKRYFPTNQIGWCRYHPDTPQFFTLDAQKAPLPIGRYPCCGERAYRFQLLENYSACQFRQHTISLDDVRQSAIFSMLESYRHLIEEESPQLLFPERLTRLVARDSSISSEKFVCKESFWWDGFEIIPPRPKMGLLSSFANRGGCVDTESIASDDSTTEELTEDETISSASLGSEEGSAESNPPPKKAVIRKTKKQNEGKMLWQHNLSARSNQDIQRAYEENVLKEMTVILSRKTINDAVGRNPRITGRNPTPLGGIWTRLETDWRESLNQRDQMKTKSLIANSKLVKPRSRF
ncbi:SANT and BTB domain regulator of class switch recombination-like isoform X2 [Anthonomus grandis grandis]|uniref:SANT and BTB domain regulator of class switch recombination-like isoform X2 n=1 Tax=Anthonomus grandis grandis TaxID=2921223 RepID=UPI0021668B92|nr:SANT and BTB domain regulator of class switch recombination-like isoform X2 [Anthonomus grandis grandis]